MPEPDKSKIAAFKTSEDLNEWLRKNHKSENELWVKIYKKDSGVPSVIWQEVVIEALCWGRIDGIKKSLDDQAYLQRITPRKPRSSWSRINTEHIERLIQEGRMKEPGNQAETVSKIYGDAGPWRKAKLRHFDRESGPAEKIQGSYSLLIGPSRIG